MKLLKLGTVALDGTKVHANASRHSATGLTQAANDKQQIAPMVETLSALPEELGEISELLTDAGLLQRGQRGHLCRGGYRPP